jgi:AraC-like DNA-binding protein
LARSWSGSTFRVAEFNTNDGALLRAPDNTSAVVSFLLAERGGPAECRLDPGVRSRLPRVPRRISFLPAGVEGWTAIDRVGSFRLACLAFDPETLRTELAELGASEALREPRLTFANERMHSLGLALAEECCAPDELSPLQCESLTISLLVELVRLRSSAARVKIGGLSRRQLTTVTEYLQDNLRRTVTLHELAELVGLSQSHLCSAFKQSTGKPPHRWQIEARVLRAEELMLDRKRSLSSIGVECGFADQAHFTRVFRRLRGLTPGAWRLSV